MTKKHLSVLLVLSILFGILGYRVFNEQVFDEEENKNHLQGQMLDTVSILDDKGDILKLEKPVVIHIHADYCPSCQRDKKLFDKLNLKEKVEVIGIKWVDTAAQHADYKKFDHVYSRLATVINTDFFVKLGMKTVPITLVADQDGKIWYSHMSSLNELEVINEIVPLILAR